MTDRRLFPALPKFPGQVGLARSGGARRRTASKFQKLRSRGDSLGLVGVCSYVHPRREVFLQVF